MKNILLPIDFSDNAWGAILTALKIFQERECTFILLNTYEPKFTNVLGGKSKERLGVIYESLAKNSELKLNDTLDYLKTNHSRSNHRFETISVSDDLVKVINQFTKERDIDLVVMGTKGATGAKEVFMGSNTVKVIKKVRSCPILAVPDEYDFKSLDAIVFPTDFTHEFGKEDLTPLIEVATNWEAEINILQVAEEYRLSEKQKNNKESLSKRLSNIKHSYHKVEMWNNVADAVTDFTKNNDMDLIALINYPHTFLEKLTREPVIRKMGFHTKVPLLVLPGIQSILSN